MNEPDIIALAAFCVSHENLIVNQMILENNRRRQIEFLEISERQGRLLERIVELLEKKE